MQQDRSVSASYSTPGTQDLAYAFCSEYLETPDEFEYRFRSDSNASNASGGQPPSHVAAWTPSKAPSIGEPTDPLQLHRNSPYI